MRLSFFLFVVLATVVASCIGFSSAENVALNPKTDTGARRLRQSVVIEPVAKSVKDIVREIEEKISKNAGKLTSGLKKTAQLSDDQAAKITKVLSNSEKAKAAIQVSDDQIVRVSTLIKNANGVADDDVAKLAVVLASAQKGAKATDDQAAKIAKVLLNSEKAKAAMRISDDEIARVSTMIKKANAEVGVADDDVAKLAGLFAVAQKSAKATDDQVFAIAKWMANAKKVGAVGQASDDEVRKVTEMFKTATGRATGAAKLTDDEVARLSKALAEAQKGAALTDKQVAKLVKMFTEAKQVTSPSNKQLTLLAQELVPVATKDKKSWSTLKKVIVATLGAAGGAAVIYTVVKLASPNEAVTA
ncbi:hypothetical protein P3T76_003315 [Phytophthora citrophthora]|uniref:Secreted RxLR effector peptide protein n=1 Tax=Phytophthora citrophthora TaxID=4793 RepID=A0AAD9LRM0_9STRA|nr:hypothetical protein P3T76_003315 [Phytophthora citrophthora]